MRAFLWRLVYAAVGFWMFAYLFPMFLGLLEIAIAGNLWTFVRAVAACIAIAYVLYPSEPPRPF